MENIIYSDLWQTFGVVIFIGLIGICIYNLRDLKRKQQAEVAAAETNNKTNWETEKMVYLKEATYIYPKKQDEYDDTSAPKHPILNGGYSNVN